MTNVREKKLPVFAVVVAALLALLPMNPAAASDHGPGAFVVAGTAALTGGIPSTGTGCFEGFAAGAHTHDTAVDLAHLVTLGAQPNAHASVDTYENLTTIAGTAEGTLYIEGTELPSATAHQVGVDFEWVRTGLVAVLSFNDATHEGSAVAAFAPTNAGPAPGSKAGQTTCPSSPGLIAQVVGAGVITAK